MPLEHRLPHWLLSAALAFPLASMTMGQATQPTVAPLAQAPAVAETDDLAALRAELEAMLDPVGSPLAPDRPATASALAQLARSAANLARTSDTLHRQLAARQLELRIYHALIQQALIRQRPSDASFRLSQLRNAAHDTRALARLADQQDIPLQLADAEAGLDARTVGDYWLLVADLIDLQRNALHNPVQHQTDAIRRLESFLSNPNVEELAMLPDLQLSLLRLYDQTGRTREARELLASLEAALPTADPRRAQLAPIAAVCEQLGQVVTFTADTSTGLWSSQDARGERVLVWFTADETTPEGKALAEAVAAARARHVDEGGLRVLTVWLGNEAETAEAAAGGPTVTDRAEALRLARLLAVRSTPRVVALDAEGRLLASGASAAVVQYEGLNAAKKNETTDEHG